MVRLFSIQILGGAALSLALLPVVSALPAQSSRPTAAAAPRVEMAPDTARLPVMLVEEDIVAFADEPAEHLARARLALRAHDTTRAATETRTAAAFLRVQSSAAEARDKAALLEAGEDLNRLAAELRRGGVREVIALDRAVRRSDLALAQHHLGRASRAWARHDTATTGRELGAAASYADRLAHDTSDEARGTLDNVARRAEKISRELTEGDGWTADAVKASLADLERALRTPSQRAG